jgi:hypothetical protein
MRIWLVLALAALLGGGLLAYRIVGLERRVDALTQRLGPETVTVSPPAGDQHAKADGTHEQRLAALEADLRALREELDALGQGGPDAKALVAADKAGNGTASGEKNILSVVEREQHRIRDRQLEFHRSRWLEWRESALDDFSQRFGLSPWQTEQLHQVLSDEVDRMVDILKRPDALENPDKAVADWLALLEQTDGTARRVLGPAQIIAWDQSRTVERKVLWPWLPNNR